ncbi:hypothetical protein [Carnobacterium funditum]|uniref:hypothetical protein n=1 Tax=Carnobacterium funditum TaxID=2752 RepID=UPI00055574A3|nr:hypothetical protein [Carnobacterium funditum]
MNQALLTKLKGIFFHPLFLIFITPLTYILIGTIYTAQLSTIAFWSFFVLYLFILINQFLEKIIHKWLQQPNKELTTALLFTEAINLLIISSFALSFHILIGLLLLLYSVLVQSQFYLIKIDLKWFVFAMKAIFKGGILTYVSFFIHLSFIPNTIFLWSIPLILLALIVEITEYAIRTKQIEQIKQNRILFLSLLTSLYISSFLILWLSFSYFSLLLLLSLPAAWSLVSLYRMSANKNSFSMKLKQLSVFSIIFLFSFALVISTRVFI